MKIEWTSGALQDLEDRYDFLISQQVPHNKAVKAIQHIKSVTKLLVTLPLLGKEFISTKSAIEYRLLIVGGYKIFYRIDNDYIYIMTVFESRQDPNRMRL